MGVTIQHPTYSVTMGSEDVTELIDLTTLSRTMTERGDAACTFTMPASGPNEIPTNALVRDAVLRISVEGATRWLGKVRNWDHSDPYSVAVEASGYWDDLHYREDFVFGATDTRTDRFEQVRNLDLGGDPLDFNSATIDTDAQVLISLPSGMEYKQGQSIVMRYVASDAGYAGQGRGAIKRVTFDYASGGITATSDIRFKVTSGWSTVKASVAPFTASGHVDWVDSSGAPGTDVTVEVYCPGVTLGAGKLTKETFLQLRNLRIYVDGTTEQRVDQSARAVWEMVTGLTNSVTDAIGSPLKQFITDGPGTPAEVITQILARSPQSPLCGAIHGRFYCINRPSSPPDKSRLWVVSDELCPGLAWGVSVDLADASDYVAFTYTEIDAQGFESLLTEYVPSLPASLTARVSLIESGTALSRVEAKAFAQQAYSQVGNFPRGSITVPHICLNGLGQESPVDHIEAWDWVYNSGQLDPQLAGPFLISEATIQDGVATLTVGNTDGYAFQAPFRLPQKGKYVGAKRVRTRELYAKWFRRTYPGKKLPKKHPKWKYGPWQTIPGHYV